jgi:hypothetical protein
LTKHTSDAGRHDELGALAERGSRDRPTPSGGRLTVHGGGAAGGWGLRSGDDCGQAREPRIGRAIPGLGATRPFGVSRGTRPARRSGPDRHDRSSLARGRSTRHGRSLPPYVADAKPRPRIDGYTGESGHTTTDRRLEPSCQEPP